jgi:hypothetical protein
MGKKIKIRIWDEQPGSNFRERIRDMGWKKSGSGIWDPGWKNFGTSGSATLVVKNKTMQKFAEKNIFEEVFKTILYLCTIFTHF